VADYLLEAVIVEALAISKEDPFAVST